MLRVVWGPYFENPLLWEPALPSDTGPVLSAVPPDGNSTKLALQETQEKSLKESGVTPQLACFPAMGHGPLPVSGGRLAAAWPPQLQAQGPRVPRVLSVTSRLSQSRAGGGPRWQGAFSECGWPRGQSPMWEK